MVSLKILLRRWKYKAHTMRNYFQNMYLIKYWSPKCIPIEKNLLKLHNRESEDPIRDKAKI